MDIGDYFLPGTEDINPSSTEDIPTHNLQGWGAIQPRWSVSGGYGGMLTEGGYCRPMVHVLNYGDGNYSGPYDTDTYPITDPYFNETGTPDPNPAIGTGDPWASIDMNFGPAGGTKTLYIRYLDGGGGANGDNFDVFLNSEVTWRLQVTTSGSPETWELAQIDVSDLSGPNTIRFVSTSPVSTFTPQYGLTCIDKVGLIIDSTDPVVEPIAVNTDPINCAGSKEVDFHLTPGSFEVRGYSVTVACDAPLTFLGTEDVFFYPVPGVDPLDIQSYVTPINAGFEYKVDFVILGGSTIISLEQDLFKVTFDGVTPGGTGTVSITDIVLRDGTNQPIIPVVTGTETIDVDCVAPTGTFVINPGDPAYTTTVDVDLILSITGATEMRFANDGAGWTGPEDGWVPIETPYDWDLSTGEGAKTVEGEFRDAAGNVFPYADGIILDTIAPTGTFVINLGDPAYTTTVDVDLILSITGATEMRFANDGAGWTGPEDGWVPIETPYDWDLSTGEGAKTVEGEFRDDAGNVFPYADGIILDTIPPGGVFVINSGDPLYTNSVDVDLYLGITGATEMRFANDGAGWTGPEDGWVPFETPYDWTLSSGDGPKTVEGEFRDDAGLVFPYVDDIILDSSAPGGVTWPTALRGNDKVTLNWTNPGGPGRSRGVARLSGMMAAILHISLSRVR